MSDVAVVSALVFPQLYDSLLIIHDIYYERTDVVYLSLAKFSVLQEVGYVTTQIAH